MRQHKAEHGAIVHFVRWTIDYTITTINLQSEHTLDADSLPARSVRSLLTNWIPDCNTRYMRDRIRRSRSSAKSDRTSKPICRKAHTHSSDPAGRQLQPIIKGINPLFQSHLNPSFPPPSLPNYTAGPNWFSMARTAPLITACPKTPSPSFLPSPPTSYQSNQSTFCNGCSFAAA